MVNVIGLGYIGLPTALMLAAHGIEVIGTDKNIELVKKLQGGMVTFEEEGLEELFQEATKSKIQFSGKNVSAEMYIIAVPTPYDQKNKKIDPEYVMKAVEEVVSIAPFGAILIIESTISPKTIDKYVRPLIKRFGLIDGKDIHLVHAPERIIPGNMINELRNNSRVIGADSYKIGEKVSKVYKSFCKGEIVVTDIKTAEMSKVVENTYRDINIAFANELAKICREDDMNVYEIIRIANMHPRVNVLQPGPGVGGHCISVDPWFLVGDYPDIANIILAARKINDSMPEFVVKRIHDIMLQNGITDLSRVGLYGITYKEDVDDVRESPTLQLLNFLNIHLASGIKCYDPYVNKKIVENQYYNLDEFLENIDMVVIMVGHSQIKKQVSKLQGKTVLDTRNIYNLEHIYKL